MKTIITCSTQFLYHLWLKFVYFYKFCRQSTVIWLQSVMSATNYFSIINRLKKWWTLSKDDYLK